MRSIVTMDLLRSVFKINGNICKKKLHPLHLRSSLRMFLKFCNGGRAEKTRMMPLPDIKNVADMTLRLHKIPALDGQTDRIRKTISCSACITC